LLLVNSIVLVDKFCNMLIQTTKSCDVSLQRAAV